MACCMSAERGPFTTPSRPRGPLREQNAQRDVADRSPWPLQLSVLLIMASDAPPANEAHAKRAPS